MAGEHDDLRRRLYTPDVTADDVERYAALVKDPGPAPESPPPPRSPVRLLVGIGAAVAVVAGTVVLAALPHPDPQPSPRPISSATAPAGDFVLAFPASVQTAFVTHLRSGRSAGLLPWFRAHPGYVPQQVRTAARAAFEEHFGAGPGMFGITPSASAQHGGRLVVAVTVDRATTVDLQVVRADSGMQSFIERLDGGAPATPGQPIVRTVVYDGEAPTIVEVTLPKGVHWDVVTALTD